MAQQRRYRELKRNTIIIAIANLGSKAISFILAPLYSYYLSTSEYGTMDLITTTAGLLMPMLCLDIYEAAFRFAGDDKYDEKTVFSSCFSLGMSISAVVIAVVFVLRLSVKMPAAVMFSVLAACFDANYYILSQFARGRGKMKIFAFSGMLNSIIILLLNFLFLVMLRYGLSGWMTAYLFAKAAVCLYLFVAVRGRTLFSPGKISREFYKEAFIYCLPLLPNASMWWIMNASDRYMIAWFTGTSANGIYAVANKIPAVLSVFENIFYQAWQTSAIQAVDDKKRDAFYSEVFTDYFILLSVGMAALLVILKPLIIFLFAPSYRMAWRCSSILVACVVVHALGGNLGTLYAVFKNTKGALFASAAGALTNIILNYIFIPMGGITAAAVTTFTGYMVVLLYRWIDIKRFAHLCISFRLITVSAAVLLLQFVLYYIDGIWSYALRAVIAALVVFANRPLFLKVMKRR